MKYIAACNLYLGNGVTIPIGGAIPNFEKWEDHQKKVHLKAGFVHAVHEKTGKVISTPQKLVSSAANHPACATIRVADQRKASKIKKRG